MVSQLKDHTIPEPEKTADGAFAEQQFTENYPSNEVVGTFYSNLTPEGYEEQMNRVNFNETYYIIDEIIRLIDDDVAYPTLTREAEIFDAGAGSGRMGTKLVKEGGLAPLVGCDASARFVQHLLDSGNYKSVSEVWMGRGLDQFPSELQNRFDVVGAAGVFLKGHMPCAAMDDCHAALKVGGFLVTAMRSLYWENGQEEGYKDKLDELVAAGKFELINSFTF
mmetsp:Transcript_5754/g.7769  ORF Transcript_5754/g.7769 Transcript_5754/m.7769 type:complete len:222 (+) Transcript_5754:26-691(+)|eukprot:CAMPEP_0185567122 /NCGR_PEP_ID=MMETSP0434-20130131/494_1 /TAXON_ID=626734 ORGANISM="Favella taraikaensis, Strain Fe Narragansett Bay" /NCGR_SAMPLE_ID=MMETSP0434 /ASSEMBLY_ACC=CAM_ASM_000379 /LENGTH=221 /DNA_ID=CAMNT_0028181275 /DNA_START=26 /DNA_END=691 /DNA_ORIENTATION=+